MTIPTSETSIATPRIRPLAPDAGLFPISALASICFGIAILLASALIAALQQSVWDYPVIWALNRFARYSVLLDRTVHALTTRDLLQGVVFIAMMWYLWFTATDVDIRARLLTGLFAASSAGVLSRLLQLALPTHLRPLHMPALSFTLPFGVEPDALNHFNSFPSDHGAAFFALALVIFRERAMLGVAAFLWAGIIDLARVYDGFHFPSDLVGSIGLALIVVTLFQNRWFNRLAFQAIAFERSHAQWFYMLAFLTTYQIATLFDDIREIGRGFASVVLHHDPFGSG
jgi:undecaprenyl-diphosphatase